MDDIDLQIVEMLKRNSRMTSSEIGKAIHLSVPAVAERIRKLEKNGVIERFTVKISRKAQGRDLVVLMFVQLNGSAETLHFRDTITDAPEVLECHHISGEYDYLLKVATGCMSELEEFITNTLKARHPVVRSNTVFILSTLKEE